MYTARMHLGLNQRLGLSRNKVAVPEGVAGTPPFWSLVPIFIGNTTKVLSAVVIVYSTTNRLVFPDRFKNVL